MAFIHLSIQDALRTARRNELIRENHEASLVRPANYKAPEPPYPIAGIDQCECGGTFDEYDACSDCANGHDDHSIQECFACMERAIDQAERMAEGDER